jgi:hypothetical protein
MITKFNVEKVFTSKSDKLGITEFIIDGIVVCTMEKYLEWYHTHKICPQLGITIAKSRLRDKTKTSYKVKWNLKNIESLTGKKPIKKRSL